MDNFDPNSLNKAAHRYEVGKKAFPPYISLNISDADETWQIYILPKEDPKSLFIT